MKNQLTTHWSISQNVLQNEQHHGQNEQHSHAWCSNDHDFRLPSATRYLNLVWGFSTGSVHIHNKSSLVLGMESYLRDEVHSLGESLP